jgi:hypothetical protein
LALLAGCSKREPIRHYTVEKPPEMAPVAAANPHAGMMPPAAAKPPTGEPTDRTLAAIVPLEPQGWFFKLTGPIDAVAAEEETFTEFLKSVKFGADGKPTWTLPEGWQQQPGNQFRFATLVIPGDAKPLEVSVTALPNTGEDNAQYILVNVNRWRGQLQMPPITAAELAAESTEIKLDGGSATVVNLAGHAAAGGMTPPFFSGAQDGN